MDRRDATLEEAYDAFLRRLRAELGVGPSQCVLSVTPDPPSIPRGSGDDSFYVVSPGELFYAEDGLIDGSPEQQITINADLQVTVVTRIWTDQEGSDERVLLDPTRGLLRNHQRVIKAATNRDLTLADGREFLRSVTVPLGAAMPQIGVSPARNSFDGDVPIAWQIIRFRMVFDLKMS